MSAVEPPFEVAFRTRGYETDATGTVPAHVFLSYLEQLRWEWMSYDPLGLRELVLEGYFFVVQQQALEVLAPVTMRRDLRATGVVEHVGRSQVHVRHLVLDEDGTRVASARVTGLWLSPKRHLVRVPDQLRAYKASQAATLAEYPTPPSLSAPKEAPADAHTHPITVRPSDLDRFSHVNAATYLRFFQDARLACAPDTGRAREVALVYDREAVAHDELVVSTWRDDGVFRFMLRRAEETLCRGAIRPM